MYKRNCVPIWKQWAPCLLDRESASVFNFKSRKIFLFIMLIRNGCCNLLEPLVHFKINLQLKIDLKNKQNIKVNKIVIRPPKIYTNSWILFLQGKTRIPKGRSWDVCSSFTKFYGLHYWIPKGFSRCCQWSRYWDCRNNAW